MKSSPPDGPLPMIDVNGPAHIDALGRTGFARELLEVIRVLPAEGGAVVGLEGEWGSGKTWVLEHLDCLNEGLLDEQQVLLVRFNPWMVSGSAEIVETYLIQLASELGTTNRRSSLRHGAEIAGKLIEYTGVLSTVKHLAPIANLLLPGSGFLLEAAGHVAGAAASAAKDMAGSTIDRLKKEPGKLSLTAAREAVKTLLRKAERRIAVLVDDLDRLPPAELAAMVQAVKAVADFPNVVYVLAYDPEAAAHALEAALRLREGEGRRYLEKIVQFGMPVPKVPAFKMQEFGKLKLRDAFAFVSLNLPDAKDLDEALPRAAALMQTPRDVVRLHTRIKLMAHKVVSEIVPADLLLVEALHLKSPQFVDYVDSHPKELLKIGGELYDIDRQYRGELGNPHESMTLEEVHSSKKGAERGDGGGWMGPNGLFGADQVPSIGAVKFLFDAASRIDGRRDAGLAARRIQRLKNWSRWRAVTQYQELYENSQLDEFLVDSEKIKNSRAWRSLGEFVELCSLIADHANPGSQVASKNFVAVFVDASSKFGVPALNAQMDQEKFGPRDALCAILQADTSHSRAEALMELVNTASVWLSEPAVWRFARPADPKLSSTQDVNKSPTGDQVAIDEIRKSWIKDSMNWLQAASAPIQGAAAFTLAYRVLRMGGESSALQGVLADVVNGRERGLEICFCERKYSDDLDVQQLELVRRHRDLLPSSDAIQAALLCCPGFQDDHGSLLECLLCSAPDLQ